MMFYAVEPQGKGHKLINAEVFNRIFGTEKPVIGFEDALAVEN